MKLLLLSLLLFNTATTLLAQDDTDITTFTVEGNVYTNPFFGFSMNVPEGWSAAKNKDVAYFTGFSYNLVQAKQQNGTCVFTAVHAERKSYDPRITTATIAADTREFVEMSYLEVTASTEPATIMMAGKTFYTFSVEGKFIDDCVKHEDFYLAEVNGYWLLFVTAHAPGNKAEQATLETALKTLKFKN